METLQRDILEANVKASAENLHEISKEETVNDLRDGINEQTWRGWVVSANSDAKPKLTGEIISSDKTRNASMNMAFYNYNDYLEQEGKKPVSFKEFMNSTITVYRGHTGQATVDTDVFSAYSYDEKVAKKFGNQIITRKVRVKDIIGGLQDNGEYEVMILNPRKK